MRATSIGHAGILIETHAGSILCDPWFVPAFLGSWCVFPRNDQLDDDLLARIDNADFLYISHLHGDHHDEPWLRTHLRRDIPIILPGYPTREQRRRLEALGFTELIPTVDTEEIEIAPGLTVAIHVETSITDGPAGDSALVVSDGASRLVNQNDCRTTDLGALAAHGPVDLHWLQYSGAIWYPMVYEMPADEMRQRCTAKVDAQFARAMRYVETIGARAIVPSAGPPAFLDPDLWQFNVITGDEMSIFPDQMSFMARLADGGHHGILAIPGTQIEITPTTSRSGPGEITVTHPMPEEDVARIFSHKEEYLRAYQADWAEWLADLRASWRHPEAAADTDGTGLITRLAHWWQPLLAMAPTLRTAIGGNCVIRALTSDDTAGASVDVLIDFAAGEVRRHAGEPFDYRFDIARDLLEHVAREHAVDWSNSLFLSCRFRAWRVGDFNEYLYNFFKSLSVERMRRTEDEALRKLHPPEDLVRAAAAAADIALGDYLVQRRCPHRNADLSVFGEIEGEELVCTLHGWRFDVHTGRCLTSEDHPLRIRRA